MIEAIRKELEGLPSREVRYNRARETLQVLALKCLSDRGAFGHLAFVGGTALRILFGLKRFSEDLDFSLTRRQGYDFGALGERLVKDLRLNGLHPRLDRADVKTVNSAFLAFPGLPRELGLSGHKEEKLSIKIEVDTNPPGGWRARTTLVNASYLFSVSHYDLPSLFAGKLHACFYRRYTKGRDIYDLFWYLGRKVRPNYDLLNNAVAQSEGAPPEVDERNLKEFMLGRLARIDLPAARRDVEKFLEDKSELRLFDEAVLRAAIDSL
ncbi:MAG: nucleotidyl transferase AbiEii/AbiGii toxin family protein [Elusimicrobiales bacterium]|nr:nucleotidyl transferase AbiEii/AbiGii toxin family protein [Elusimicrobiales bacterium]